MDKSTTHWFDEMATELRLREVRGRAIGDAVAEVETHCHEAGQSPQEMFGDPRGYARSLAFPDHELISRTPGQWMILLAPMLLGGLAFLLAGPLGAAVARRGQVELEWGSLLSLAVTMLFAVAVVRWTAAIVQERTRGLLFFMGAVTLATMLAVLVPGVALRLPVPPTAAVVLALLVASVVGMYRRLDEFSDPLVDPRGVDSPVDRHPRATRALIALLPWLFPAAAAGAALLEWWLA